jgi:hypothetical protein
MAMFGKSSDKSGDRKSEVGETETDASSAAAGPSASLSARTAAAAGTAQPTTLRYVDRPDLAETFADSITGLFFDGQSLRIEFAVSRMDEIKPNAPITGRRYPACRIVLPPGAAVDLINKMQQIGAALAKAGVVRQSEPPKS